MTGDHTHSLSAPASAYPKRPAVLPEEATRTRAEISREQSNLNRLFFTEKTQRRIVAPTNRGPFVDEVTGEMAWPAFRCHNPNCPEKGTADEPFLFTFPDRNQRQICPACTKEIDVESAPIKELQPHLIWTRAYDLPETARRVKQLDAERKRAYAAEKRKQ